MGKRENNVLSASSQPFQLPPNFSEKGHAVHIDYHMNVMVERGMFLTDSV
jgi:hypothetical protein